MNKKEIENVISLEPLERYRHFIKKVADWEVFFTLIDINKNYLLSHLDGEKLFPVWSSEEYAKLCQIAGWENSIIKKLDLDDLENEIIDFIVDEECLINVFPIYDKTGFVVNLKEFTRDLNEELKNYQ
ncbi:DUF2750 domain-containing protein [Chryseobacterium pennipullorum]|uniref:DUF2750 domain-containing protein n=1 Tax=Chryseobacterium pennipullorum TaxID=2258963 RepID=A0A3D9AJR3_9FLAO|nr:DUF2750 domain-containing protein [Chryseobacterium pennipullorum]REC41603.1 DUF2750 domain-containing protein [Chryseobacterium pennipullorum]